MGLVKQSPKEAMAALRADPVYQLMENWKMVYDEKIAPEFNQKNERIDELQRMYMAALIKVFPSLEENYNN